MKAGIVGAGIMGRLLAFALSKQDWHVTLFDQGSKNNCSMAAAGLLTPVAELEKNDPIIFHLGTEALEQHWPAILAQLPKKIFFQKLGSLVLSHPRDQAELIRFAKMISGKIKQENYCRMMHQEEIKNLESNISNFRHGCYFPNEGQIDSQTLLIELENHLTANHVVWHEDIRVIDIQPKRVYSTDEIYTFDIVFDCRGLGAKTIFNDLRSMRGELIWLHAPDVTINRPIRFLHPRYHLYIVPRPDQIYLIGASEIESLDYSSISVRTTLELLTAAYCVQPNFSEARILKTITQCRPVLSDHLPKIKFADGLIAVNGLYRHGFLIAPTLVVEIMQWLQQGITTIRYPQLWEKYE